MNICWCLGNDSQFIPYDLYRKFWQIIIVDYSDRETLQTEIENSQIAIKFDIYSNAIFTNEIPVTVTFQCDYFIVSTDN